MLLSGGTRRAQCTPSRSMAMFSLNAMQHMTQEMFHTSSHSLQNVCLVWPTVPANCRMTQTSSKKKILIFFRECLEGIITIDLLINLLVLNCQSDAPFMVFPMWYKRDKICVRVWIVCSWYTNGLIFILSFHFIPSILLNSTSIP